MSALKQAPVSDAGGAVVVGSSRFTLAQSVGERIKWARERRDLTQKELAHMAGKSRASVVQYEQNRIAAPLSVIDDLARVLNVAPEYLAFGRAGISGIVNAQEEVEVIEEISSGKDGIFTSGGWAIPRSMFSDYSALVNSKIKLKSLNADEPGFNLARGDRVVIDTKSGLTKDGLYLVNSSFGSRLVRIRMGFTANGLVTLINGVDGSTETVDPSALDVVGLVIGEFRRTF